MRVFACCTGYTAALSGVQHAFTCLSINMIAIDALQEFARALCTSADLPACDGARAGSAMQTAVVHIVEFACVFKDVHVFGT